MRGGEEGEKEGTESPLNVLSEADFGFLIQFKL
jgi:hypothetical protein